MIKRRNFQDNFHLYRTARIIHIIRVYSRVKPSAAETLIRISRQRCTVRVCNNYISVEIEFRSGECLRKKNFFFQYIFI